MGGGGAVENTEESVEDIVRESLDDLSASTADRDRCLYRLYKEGFRRAELSAYEALKTLARLSRIDLGDIFVDQSLGDAMVEAGRLCQNLADMQASVEDPLKNVLAGMDANDD